MVEMGEWMRVFFSRMAESEYETCSSDLQSSTDENSNDDDGNRLLESTSHARRKSYRHQRRSISRTDSGVSLNTNQGKEINLSSRKANTIYSSGKSAGEKAKCVTSQSIISSIFDGQIQSQIECLTCNRRSITVETFQDLSLPIPSREQLEVNEAASLQHRFTSILEIPRELDGHG